MRKYPLTISAICPVRDERQNIGYIFRTLKPLGHTTELIFVEGGSSDGSWKEAQKYDGRQNKHGVLFHALQQKGMGKAGAVTTGFDQAQGKYLIIVDADLSIGQTDLENILKLFQTYGDQILVSGNRLQGWTKPKAFYWINYVGNYFFRYYYSFILGQSILDISCGTKGLSKTAWKKLRALRAQEGLLDRWGDIDWLYYGKRVGLTAHFAPITYTERIYGESKLQNVTVRWGFAWKMLMIGLRILRRDREL